MPIFKFLVVTGFTLITLLFAANAMLQPGSPPIVTSQRTGLPAPVSQCGKSSHQCASTGPRHDLASCTRCSAQVGA